MTTPAVGLQTHIWNNNLKSILLLTLYPLIITGIIWAIITVITIMTAPNAQWDYVNAQAGSFIIKYWPIIILAVSVWFTIAYFFHTKMIRKMVRSHPVTRTDEPELYNLLENLCISIGLPTPQLEIIESHARNAFASGIDKKSYRITVTRGLLQSLSKDEVEGVLAHELTHILNNDVRLLIITIIFTGMLGFAAQMVWSNVRYSLWIGGRRSNGKENGQLILIFILCILWLGYFATIFTRFALSQRREYMADAGAIKITKNPDAMMRALMRIAGKDQIPKMPGDITMMCIENRKPFMRFFKTHPPIESRIQILSDMTGTPIPNLPQIKPFHAPRAPRNEVFAPPLKHRENWTTRQRFKNRKKSPWKK